MKGLKAIFLGILVATFIFLYHFSNYSFNDLFFKPSIRKNGNHEDSRLINYAPNYQYMINNNLAQYSSYVIIDKDSRNKTIYTIEGFVQLNLKYVKKFGTKKDFLCLVKFLNNINETIELEVTHWPKFKWDYNRKIICSIKIDKTTDLNNLLVAIIWKNDYKKDLKINKFINSLNKLKEKQVSLPYSLIKFQKPTIIHALQERLPSVSFCVHYTYAIPPQLFNWIDFHLSIGVGEIMLYDSLEDKSLTKSIKEHYGSDKRLTIMPYNISLSDICDDSILFKQYTEQSCPKVLRKFLTESCKQFYNDKFRKRFEWRRPQEQLSVNDCFTVLSKKHEFIGYYDFDEFVYPRTMDNLKDFYENKTFYKCDDDHSRICSLKPFENNFKVQRSDNPANNYLYNYLHSIIEENRNGRDLQLLGSIRFLHAAVLIPNHVEKKLLTDLGTIIERIEMDKNNSIVFPLSLYLSEEPYTRGHRFLIEKDDVNYIKYLYKAYNSFFPCVYKKYLNNINQIDSSLVRYLYYITEFNERWPKEIHYYKNVKSIWNHWVIETDKNAWSFTPSPENGHFLPHYRADIAAIYKKNYNATIRKLNVDFEYSFYLLKKYTNFCKV